MDCRERGLGQVPGGLPHGTWLLELGGNNLTEIRSGAFAGLWSLRVLVLADNRIRALQAQVARRTEVRVGDPCAHFFFCASPQAFFSLSYLEKLDLSGNRLAHLPADFSAGLSALRQLRLERNDLRHLSTFRCDSLQSALARTQKIDVRPHLFPHQASSIWTTWRNWTSATTVSRRWARACSGASPDSGSSTCTATDSRRCSEEASTCCPDWRWKCERARPAGVPQGSESDRCVRVGAPAEPQQHFRDRHGGSGSSLQLGPPGAGWEQPASSQIQSLPQSAHDGDAHPARRCVTPFTVSSFFPTCRIDLGAMNRKFI